MIRFKGFNFFLIFSLIFSFKIAAMFRANFAKISFNFINLIVFLSCPIFFANFKLILCSLKLNIRRLNIELINSITWSFLFFCQRTSLFMQSIFHRFNLIYLHKTTAPEHFQSTFFKKHTHTHTQNRVVDQHHSVHFYQFQLNYDDILAVIQCL